MPSDSISLCRKPEVHWLQCARRTKIRPLSGWRRPPGRPRQTWLHQIGDGSAASIGQEWDLAVRHGHSRRTRSVLQAPSTQVLWWWWWCLCALIVTYWLTGSLWLLRCHR